MTDFDPFAYTADIKAHLEKYVTWAEIVRDAQALHKIRHAATLTALKEAFHGPAKLAKATGDTELLGWLTEAATKRRKELEAQ